MNHDFKKTAKCAEYQAVVEDNSQCIFLPLDLREKRLPPASPVGGGGPTALGAGAGIFPKKTFTKIYYNNKFFFAYYRVKCSSNNILK